MKKIFPIVFAITALAVAHETAQAADVKLPGAVVSSDILEPLLTEAFKADSVKVEQIQQMLSLRFPDGTNVLVGVDQNHHRILIFDVIRLAPKPRQQHLELANRVNEKLDYGVSTLLKFDSEDENAFHGWALVNKLFIPMGTEVSGNELCQHIRQFWHTYSAFNLKSVDPDGLVQGDLASTDVAPNKPVQGRIGIEINDAHRYKGYFILTDVAKGSPAWKAGLREGDLIGKINGVVMENKSVAETMKLIADSGSQIYVTFINGKTSDVKTVSLEKGGVKFAGE